MPTIEDFLAAFGDDQAAVEGRIAKRLRAVYEFRGPRGGRARSVRSVLAAAERVESDALWAILWDEAQAWWERQVDPGLMATLLDAISADPFWLSRRWLALMYAESVGHLTSDPQVAECRLVTRRWLFDQASDAELETAGEVAGDAAGDATDDAARDAARAVWAATDGSAWVAAEAAAEAAACGAGMDMAWDAARTATMIAAASAHYRLLARATRAMLPPLREAVHPQSPRAYEAAMDDVLARMRVGDLLEGE